MTIIYSIYKFVNQLNGKCYIGFTGNINQRLSDHKNQSKIKNTPFYRAVRKHGWESFSFEIVYQSKDYDYCLRVMEPYFIKEYNSYGCTGYNATLGGQCSMITNSYGELVGIRKGVKPSPETIEKYKVRSKNNKARLGIPHSEEIKKIISERTSLALKGKPKSKVKCPHCDKIGGAGNMKRYHFDFCKLKTTLSLDRVV